MRIGSFLAPRLTKSGNATDLTHLGSKSMQSKSLSQLPLEVSAQAAVLTAKSWKIYTKHFSAAVARRTGLRIGTPADSFLTLSQEIK